MKVFYFVFITKNKNNIQRKAFKSKFCVRAQSCQFKEINPERTLNVNGVLFLMGIQYFLTVTSYGF